jgi:hypothetical protein
MKTRAKSTATKSSVIYEHRKTHGYVVNVVTIAVTKIQQGFTLLKSNDLE